MVFSNNLRFCTVILLRHPKNATCGQFSDPPTLYPKRQFHCQKVTSPGLPTVKINFYLYIVLFCCLSIIIQFDSKAYQKSLQSTSFKNNEKIVILNAARNWTVFKYFHHVHFLDMLVLHTALHWSQHFLLLGRLVLRISEHRPPMLCFRTGVIWVGFFGLPVVICINCITALH